jgi:hypothetical protein
MRFKSDMQRKPRSLEWHLSQAEERLKEGDSQSARGHLDYVDASSRLKGPRVERGLLSSNLIVAVVCGIVLTVGSVYRVGSTHVSARVSASGLTIALDPNDTSVLKHVYGARTVEFSEVSEWSAPSEDASSRERTSSDERVLRTSGARVSDVRLEDPGEEVRLSFELISDELHLFVKGAGLRGAINYFEGERSEPGQLFPRSPREIGFETVVADSQGPPVNLTFRGGIHLEARGASAKSFKFAEEERPGRGELMGTINSGSVRFHGLNRREELERGDELEILFDACEAYDVRYSNGELHLLLKGDARAVTAGISGYEKNLMPTYLEYYYQNHTYSTLWGGGGLLLGLMSGLRKLLRN